MPNLRVLENALPVAPLKIVAMESFAKMGRSIDNYLVEFRKHTNTAIKEDPAFNGYLESTYLLNAECPRFGTGEGKGIFYESVRGKDLFILIDGVASLTTGPIFGSQSLKV